MEVKKYIAEHMPSWKIAKSRNGDYTVTIGGKTRHLESLLNDCFHAIEIAVVTRVQTDGTYFAAIADSAGVGHELATNSRLLSLLECYVYVMRDRENPKY